jgi:hypothetical protein
VPVSNPRRARHQQRIAEHLPHNNTAFVRTVIDRIAVLPEDGVSSLGNHYWGAHGVRQRDETLAQVRKSLKGSPVDRAGVVSTYRSEH